MRQHFQTAKPIASVPVLSVEEEAIASQEIDQHLADANETAEQVQQLADIQNVVSDTVLVVSYIPEVGTAEEILTNAVGEMATAGDSADPADVLPITKTEDGLSTEGIVDKVKEIWTKIAEFIAKMWKHVMDFLNSAFGKAERLKARLVELAKTYKELGAISPSDVGIGSRTLLSISFAGAFHLGGKPVDLTKLDSEIQKLKTMIGSLYRHAPAAVLELGRVIEDGFKKFNPDEVAKGLEYTPANESMDNSAMADFTRRLSESFEKYTHCFSDITKMSHSGDDTIISSGPLLGNFHIEMRLPGNMDNASPIDVFGSLTKIKPKVVSDAGESNAYGIQQALQPTGFYGSIIASVEQCVDLILDYKSGKVAEKLQHQGEAMKKAADAALAKLKEGKNDSAASIVRGMLPLNAAYSNWSKEPMTGAIAGCLKTFSCFVEMAEGAAAIYKKNKAGMAKAAPSPAAA